MQRGRSFLILEFELMICSLVKPVSLTSLDLIFKSELSGAGMTVNSKEWEMSSADDVQRLVTSSERTVLT